MESENKNPNNLKIGQNYLIRHRSNWSPWIEVKIVHFNQDKIPVGKCPTQDFFQPITDEYEIDIITLSAKEEARKAWLERALRDKHQYPNEESAFSYFWEMSHYENNKI